MSLHWMLIAGFLYVQIATVLILVLPIISVTKWQKFFKSGFVRSLREKAKVLFLMLIAILILFLLDAIREMRKYSMVGEHSDHSHLDAEMQANMRLFRAQRNFYIAGFSLFLTVVIKRLVHLISWQAVLLAENEASMRQAQSATASAKALLQQQNLSPGESAQNDSNEAYDKTITALKNQLEETQTKYKKLKTDFDKLELDKKTIVSQSKALTDEYNRLCDEHKKCSLSTTDKKSD